MIKLGKKSLASIVAVSLLTFGGTSVFASSDIPQEQTNDASVEHNQGAESSAPIDPVQLENGNSSIIKVQLGDAGIAGQGQAGSVTGVQVQSVKTSGPALLTQTLLTKLKLTDKQTTDSSQQNMETSADNSLNQTTATEEPTQVVQAQIDHTAAIHLEVSIAGGPTIQYQKVHRTSVQYLNAVKSVSPLNGLLR